jgi:hypothetical protein
MQDKELKLTQKQMVKYKWTEIIKLFNEGKSLTEIGKIVGIHRKYLYPKFAAEEINTNRVYGRIHFFDEHWFDEIDTEEKAYMLGFIYADGSVGYSTGGYTLRIGLAAKDIHILKHFNKLISEEDMVKEYEDNEKRKYCKIALHSKQMVSTLRDKWGVCENKSTILKNPTNLDLNLYSHFVRGMIDGDGWIYITSPKAKECSCSVNLINSIDLNNHLVNYFKEILNIDFHTTEMPCVTTDDMSIIAIKSFARCTKFLDWLYKDSNMYLTRKYNKYQLIKAKYNSLPTYVKNYVPRPMTHKELIAHNFNDILCLHNDFGMSIKAISGLYEVKHYLIKEAFDERNLYFERKYCNYDECKRIFDGLGLKSF